MAGIQFKIIKQLQAKQIEQLHQLYLQEWWTDTRTLEETRLVVENSSLVVGIVDDDDDLLAFARVLSDFVFKAMIFDVIVSKDARGQGLSDILMGHIESDERLRRVKRFELYCLPEMEGYYEKRGYFNTCGEYSFMRKTIIKK